MPKRKLIAPPSVALIPQPNASSDPFFPSDWPLPPPPALLLSPFSPAPASISSSTPTDVPAPMLTSANVPPPPLRALPPAELNAAVRQMFSLDDDSEELAENLAVVRQTFPLDYDIEELTDKLPAVDERDVVMMLVAETTLAPATEPVPVPAAEPVPVPAAEPVPAEEPVPARAAESTLASAAEPTLATVAELVPVCAVDVQATAPEQAAPTEEPARPVVRLVDRVREHPVDCFRCSQTDDGLWHTLVHALDFYRELYAISQWREEAGAEQRWYAALARAGVARGEECSALRWPLTNAAALSLTAKVHPVVWVAVHQLCWDFMAQGELEARYSLYSFTEKVIAPSLLCLHEQVRQRHETLQSAEEALEALALEKPRKVEESCASEILGELSLMLTRAMRPDAVARLYCSVISAPSIGMQYAYQKTKCETPALTATDGPTTKYVPVALTPPPLPEEALPIGLRRSIDNERIASKTAALSDISCASPRSIVARDYKTLFSDNNY
jgi:hypothetical protein